MYPLKENPTLAQIIVRSVICHPSLLAETLEGIAAEDHRFAATRPETIHPGILVHAKHCAVAAHGVRSDLTAFEPASAADWELMPLGVQIVAAASAAELQRLPRHILTQAAIRTDDRRSLTKLPAQSNRRNQMPYESNHNVNVEECLALADFLESLPEELFNMGKFAEHECGTPACIGGWLARNNREEFLAKHLDPLIFGAKKLGLTYDQAYRLFINGSDMPKFSIFDAKPPASREGPSPPRRNRRSRLVSRFRVKLRRSSRSTVCAVPDERETAKRWRVTDDS
ncbi:unnamed protein product [Sphagnum jensenii]